MHMPTRWIWIALAAALVPAALPGAGRAASAGAEASPAIAAQAPTLYLLHLPGIGGERSIDRTLVSGLKQGGVRGRIEIHDWTGPNPGLLALRAQQRNIQEAARIAERILAIHREHPDMPIFLTCHSGGAGLAVWALEQLPEEVKVESVLMLAPALSPGYDLSKALARVRGRMYVFSSPFDGLVLGTGTKMFGTIDGVKCEAAGMVGFTRPQTADVRQYEKLVPQPYDRQWMRLGNLGDHVGPMGTVFAREVLAGLLLGRPAASTQPAQAQAR